MQSDEQEIFRPIAPDSDDFDAFVQTTINDVESFSLGNFEQEFDMDDGDESFSLPKTQEMKNSFLKPKSTNNSSSQEQSRQKAQSFSPLQIKPIEPKNMFSQRIVTFEKLNSNKSPSISPSSSLKQNADENKTSRKSEFQSPQPREFRLIGKQFNQNSSEKNKKLFQPKSIFSQNKKARTERMSMKLEPDALLGARNQSVETDSPQSPASPINQSMAGNADSSTYNEEGNMEHDEESEESEDEAEKQQPKNELFAKNPSIFKENTTRTTERVIRPHLSQPKIASPFSFSTHTPLRKMFVPSSSPFKSLTLDRTSHQSGIPSSSKSKAETSKSSIDTSANEAASVTSVSSVTPLTPSPLPLSMPIRDVSRSVESSSLSLSHSSLPLPSPSPPLETLPDPIDFETQIQLFEEKDINIRNALQSMQEGLKKTEEMLSSLMERAIVTNADMCFLDDPVEKQMLLSICTSWDPNCDLSSLYGNVAIKEPSLVVI